MLHLAYVSMKSFILIFYAFLLMSEKVHASDTTWLNNKWKFCEKQNATYFELKDRQDSLYRRSIFYVSNGAIYQEAFFTDEKCSNKTGLHKTFTAEGRLIDSTRFINNRIVSVYTFHPNGNKKSMAEFSGPAYTYNRYANSWKEDGTQSTLDSFYHDRAFMLCHKDTASVIEYVAKTDSGWLVNFKSLTNNAPVSRSFFTDRNFQQLQYAVWLSANNTVKDSVVYKSSKSLDRIFKFHPNGQPSAILEFDEKSKYSKSTHWDEAGKPIKKPTDFTYATPAEGFRSWQRKILKKINNDERIPWDKRKNLYGSVFISFIIDENGNQQEVFIQQTSPYPEMDNLILEYCKENIPWKPAIYFGRRENFRGTHSFSFIKGKVIKYSTLY